MNGIAVLICATAYGKKDVQRQCYFKPKYSL